MQKAIVLVALVFSMTSQAQIACEAVFIKKSALTSEVSAKVNSDGSNALGALLPGSFTDLELSSLFFARPIRKSTLLNISYDEFMPASKNDLKNMFEGTPFAKDIESNGLTKRSLWTQGNHYQDSTILKKHLTTIVSRFKKPLFFKDYSPDSYILNDPNRKNPVPYYHKNSYVAANRYSWSLFAHSISNIRSKVAAEFDAIPLGYANEGIKTIGDLIRQGSLTLKEKNGQISTIYLIGDGLQIAKAVKNGVQFYYLEVGITSNSPYENGQEFREILFLPPSLSLTRMSTLYHASFGSSAAIKHPHGNYSYTPIYMKTEIDLDHIAQSEQSLRERIGSSFFNTKRILARGFNPRGTIPLVLGSGEHRFTSVLGHIIDLENYYSPDYIPSYKASQLLEKNDHISKLPRVEGKDHKNLQSVYQREIEEFKNQSPNHADFWESMAPKFKEWRIPSPRFVEYVPFRREASQSKSGVDSLYPDIELVTIQTTDGMRIFLRSSSGELNTNGQLMPLEYGKLLKKEYSFVSLSEPRIRLDLRKGDGDSILLHLKNELDLSATSSSRKLQIDNLNSILEKSKKLRTQNEFFNFTKSYSEIFIPLQKEIAKLSKSNMNMIVYSRWLHDFGLNNFQSISSSDQRRLHWDVDQTLTALDETVNLYHQVVSEYEAWFGKLDQDRQLLDKDLSSSSLSNINIQDQKMELENQQKELLLNIEVIRANLKNISLARYNLGNIQRAIKAEL